MYSALSLALVVSLLVLSGSANARALPSQCPPNKLWKPTSSDERRMRGEARLWEDSRGPQAWECCRGCCISGGKQIMGGKQTLQGCESYLLGDTDPFMRGGCPGRRRTLFAFMSLAV